MTLNYKHWSSTRQHPWYIRFYIPNLITSYCENLHLVSTFRITNQTANKGKKQIMPISASISASTLYLEPFQASFSPPYFTVFFKKNKIDSSFLVLILAYQENHWLHLWCTPSTESYKEEAIWAISIWSRQIWPKITSHGPPCFFPTKSRSPNWLSSKSNLKFLFLIKQTPKLYKTYAT